MAKTNVTTNDLQNFFSAYGVAKPIDFSQASNPGWKLRESMEGLTSQFTEVTASVLDGRIRLDQLKKVPGTSARVFNALAKEDGEAYLSFYELALGLEKAGLLKLPPRESAATLWQSPGSVQWGLVKHNRQSELGNYLESRRNDDAARGNALMVLGTWADQDPSNFEGTLAFDGRIIEIMLASHNSQIRDPFLALFQTPEEVAGGNPTEVFNNLERDFALLLSRLRTQDLGIVQELTRDSNPRKVVFALLCAKKLLSKVQFNATCKKFLPGRSPLAGELAYRTGRNSITLGQLAQELVQDRNTPIRLAGIEY